ncbi:hypothetical protein SAMN04487996_101195 [Dyadobacter soli]|uniref:Uncharacterized protein n=1 Tax=Dyadobacter soli TaxID=659014 RepID=A0A1G6VCV2_9BACT|nr:hypothetical protein [Dyadobacter soli]SDD50837.1 hypothetical protein SAMN04487996_101195 [Dyadobacter soli]
MNLDSYPCFANETHSVYEFVSQGQRGAVKKIVEYAWTGLENVYNLGFGDYDEVSNEINDLVVTNNGDCLKVLATVAWTVREFMFWYPDKLIFATGSTGARTRLYRIGIVSNLNEIKEYFVIFGKGESDFWEEFETGKYYSSFLLGRKENKDEIWKQIENLDL